MTDEVDAGQLERIAIVMGLDPDQLAEETMRRGCDIRSIPKPMPEHEPRDGCDEHLTTFSMGGECPDCKPHMMRPSDSSTVPMVGETPDTFEAGEPARTEAQASIDQVREMGSGDELDTPRHRPDRGRQPGPHHRCYRLGGGVVRSIKLPNGAGTIIHMGTDAEADAHERVIKARHEFNLEYCKARGWPTDPEKLTIAQIIEIGEQPGWKDAGQ